MRSIDMHAHLTPQCFIRAMQAGKEWHGVKPGEERIGPRNSWTPEQRVADMNSLGVDVHVVSTAAGFYYYDRDAETVAAMHRECNDEVRQMTMDYPERFKGFAQIPMQDVKGAITELDRAVNQLGLVGAMIDDKVNGRTYDDPEFLPLWKAAEQMGALMFIHQGGETLVRQRTNRYHLPNTIGNLVDRAVTFASFVFGGVMDACPDLNDCLTHSEEALRYLIDTVGVDRVVFGTDWPADMAIDWPVSWVLSLESLTQEEKEAILWKNLEKLLGI